MDPLLFGIHADVVAEVIGTIIVLSLFIERGLAPLFEWRLFIQRTKDKGWKEPIALILSFLVVSFVRFDALAVIFSREANSALGYVITAGVVAGGSKGSIKLFRDFLGWKSSAQEAADKAAKAASAPAAPPAASPAGGAP